MEKVLTQSVKEKKNLKTMYVYVNNAYDYM
jgi:hypothetical protein